MKKLVVALALAGMVGSVSAATLSALTHNSSIVSLLGDKEKGKKKEKKDKTKKEGCCHGGCCHKKDAAPAADTPK
jgi:hypothetical protein